MTRTLSRNQRRAAFVEAAVEMFEQMEVWYDEHPEASFGEIEAQARQQRRQLMGEALGLLINGRDTGFRLEEPVCARCGQAMKFEGYRSWTIHGLEGDTRLERAYYVCPNGCGETIFPPGPETDVACGSLE